MSYKAVLCESEVVSTMSYETVANIKLRRATNVNDAMPFELKRRKPVVDQSLSCHTMSHCSAWAWHKPAEP